MATSADTSDRDNSHGRTTEVEEQLDRLVDVFEAVDWRRVDGLTTAEAAALGERLRDVEVKR